MSGGFLRWKSHVDKLLRFNHMTMTISAESFRVVESGAQILQKRSREHLREQRLAIRRIGATTTIQYAFDSTSNFPTPFLTDSPRFHSSFEPSLRHLPCILFLHGSDPGGFDVARWMAGGMSRVHQLQNPLMPSRFGSYSVYNVQERSRLHADVSKHVPRVHEDGPVPQEGAKPSNVEEWMSPPFTVPTPPFSLLSLSRPGYLESSFLQTPTFLAQAAAIAQLVDNLRIPSIHVVAHKIAAPLALEMATLAGFRRRIRSISLIDPQLEPRGRLQQLTEGFFFLGPEWARTRAAYNALARSADDSYFRRAVSELCGTASLTEIDDDPTMAQLYEGIGVFFTQWNARKSGVLNDALLWNRLDRGSWSLVKAPILCLTSTNETYGDKSHKSGRDAYFAAEETAKATLANVRGSPEFACIYGSGKLLFPLANVSKMCLDFIYRHQ